MVVEIPNQWFNLIANTTMGAVVNIQGLLGGEDNLNAVGLFNNGDADILEVCTWSVVSIPNKYMGLFLSQPEGVTSSHYYFETILPVIEADGMGQTCMSLTHFCQIAITLPAANGVSPLQVVFRVSAQRQSSQINWFVANSLMTTAK